MKTRRVLVNGGPNSPIFRLQYSGSNIQDKIREHLFRRVTTVLTTLRRGNFSRYLNTKVDEDTTPDVMDSTGVVLR